jgi:nitrate/nitrite transport system permease protein
MINAEQLGGIQPPPTVANKPNHRTLLWYPPKKQRRIFSQLLLVIGGFAILLALWQALSMLSTDLPSPAATLPEFWKLISNPFYDHGPNDKGIGLQVLMSLGRVFSGWLIGSAVAIPIGLLMGSNKMIMGLFNPVIQVLRPVSPLAWYPIGLAVYKNAGNAVTFAIIITSLWPTLINTMMGVSSLPDDYRNVSRVFAFSRWKYLTKVLIPYALPHILTGLRLSMGIAWMVIVAGEMLSGSTGIGFFVWDSWNALSLERVISAILIIGLIGLILDRSLEYVTARVRYSS